MKIPNYQAVEPDFCAFDRLTFVWIYLSKAPQSELVTKATTSMLSRGTACLGVLGLAIAQCGVPKQWSLAGIYVRSMEAEFPNLPKLPGAVSACLNMRSSESCCPLR